MVSNLTLAKKQLLNDKITTSCPICLISTISNVTKCSNNKYELWKTIRAQNVCPSMPSFVSAVLFIPSFNVLSCYFYNSLNLVAVPTAWILTNFGTQLLYNVTLLTFATNNSPQLNSLVALTVYRYSIFQTLQRKLFQRKCKPITMSEEPHKINNLVNNQKINIIEKLCHLQFPFFVFFLKTIDPCFFNTWSVNIHVIHVSAGKTPGGWFASCGNIVWISSKRTQSWGVPLLPLVNVMLA